MEPKPVLIFVNWLRFVHQKATKVLNPPIHLLGTTSIRRYRQVLTYVSTVSKQIRVMEEEDNDEDGIKKAAMDMARKIPLSVLFGAFLLQEFF